MGQDLKLATAPKNKSKHLWHDTTAGKREAIAAAHL